MKRSYLTLLFALVGCTSFAADGSASGAAGQSSDAEDGWSIKHGCIPYSSIKRIHFKDNESGLIELRGGRKATVALKANCSGIRNEGYVHKPLNGQFCEGDSLRVVHFGSVCIVGKIEPLIAVVE